MKGREKKDIFISYRNDGEGNNFAVRLKEDLEREGYTVYFNSHEQNAGVFPERLKNAVLNCKDFILILSGGCLKQLLSNNKIDWVREELLCAKTAGKNIIPVIIGNIEMPGDKTDLPEQIQFLADLEAVYLPEQYIQSPFHKLLAMFKAVPVEGEYQYSANSNPNYDVHADFCATLEKAKSGDTKAMYEVACMYVYGFASEDDEHGKINYKGASKWLKTLLSQYGDLNDAPTYVKCAYVMLATSYYSGSVAQEKQSFNKTIAMLENMKVEDNEEFSFIQDKDKVIFMMIEGIGTKFDYNEVLEYLEQYEMSCSNNAKDLISKFYMRYGLFDRAINIMESVCEDYPDIDYRLGKIYLQGLHCNPPKPDVYRAEHYFSNAAYNGHLDAIHALGLLNFRGQYGYRQNLNRARSFYLEAAQKGHKAAQYDYAWMCKYGLGGEKNIEEAIYYFEQAAMQGSLLSRSELATLYQEPERRNYQKAFEWAKKAAEVGDAWGEFILGNLYFFGRGCEANLDKAVIYYRKAYEQGFYQAKFMIDKIKDISI